jgi:hypothetical protein
MSPSLLGLHDLGGEHLMDGDPGWIVDAIAFSETRSRDYRAQASRGFGIISRLNWGWNPRGTIPEPARYGEMASICAEFVTVSQGCHIWIVGNEFNHIVEHPDGRPITPEDAAACHRLCYAAIKQVQPNARVLVAAVAPWYDGAWLDYLRRLVRGVGDQCQGYALHAPTHGPAPALVFSDEERGGFAWHMRTYRQQIATILDAHPAAIHAEFYITETNQGDDAWVDTNSGWVQNAAREINDWNQMPGTPDVRSICLYRWKHYDHDKWGIEHKPGVQQDFRAAVALGYQSPPDTTHLPSVISPAPTPPAPALPPRQWDKRLAARGVTIETPTVKPGTVYWRVIAARWYSEAEAGGRHHIYVEAITPDGRPVVNEPFDVRWPGGGATESTKAGRGFEAGNFPMSPSLSEFSVAMGDGVPSETVRGIGMGADGNPGIHTSTLVTFQLTTMPVAQQPAPTPQEPVIGPGPTPPAETPTLRYVTAPAGGILRANPTVESDRLIAVPYGEAVAISQSTNAEGYLWTRASWQGYDGWIRGDLLGATQPPAPAPVADEGPTPAPSSPAGIIDPLVALAFLQVESANRAFTDNLLTIRFEVHVFKTELRNDALFDMHFRFTPREYSDQWWRPTPNADWINAHGPMPERHKLLSFARSLNDTAALRSTGLGSAQVMGANHARIGYATPQAMFNAFKHPRFGVNAQVLGFVNYVLSDPALADALRRRDWWTAITKYNGDGQQAHYTKLLQQALAEIQQAVAS